MAPFLRLFVFLLALLWASLGACASPPQLPACSLPCFAAAVSPSVCNPGEDISCICQQADVTEKIVRCVKSSCTAREAVMVMMMEEAACGKPPRNRKSDFLLSLAITIPAFLMILVRVYSRMVVAGKLETDDVAMVVCGITYTGLQALIQMQGAAALGVDVWHVSPDDLSLGLKLLYAIEILYIITLTLAKVSILIFCLRLFSERSFRAVIYGVLAFVIEVNVVLLGVQIFQCIPFEANWETWRLGYAGPFKCINVNHFVIAGAGLNILQELVIMILPMPGLARLSLSRRAKLNAVALFGLAILTIIMSCVRIAYIIPVTDSPNISWDYTDPIIWTGVEAAVTVIIPCLPALRALMNRWSVPRPQFSQQQPILQSRRGALESSRDRGDDNQFEEIPLDDLGPQRRAPSPA